MIYVDVVAGEYRCYRLVNGRYKLPVGPLFVSPRDAVEYADIANRAPSEGADVKGPALSPGARAGHRREAE